MTITCNEIEAARILFCGTPLADRPRWMRHPRTNHEFQVAFGVACCEYPNIEPICQDGILVGWAGIGFTTGILPDEEQT